MSESSYVAERGERTALHAVILLLVPALLTACAPATSQVTDGTPVRCVIVDDEPRAHLTIGVAGVGADAADARARAERLLSAQVFETLVRVDCTGAVVGVLAEAWSSTDGRTWRFRLRPGAAFRDGVPVTARTVLEAWSAARLPAFAALSQLGQMELAVTLVAGSDVRVFADPAHAVKRRTSSGFVGTGAFQFHGDPAGLRIVTASNAGFARSITVRLFAGDPRNALDADVDALVTGDPATLEYARARSNYVAVPLPWSRTYVMASPGPDPGSRPPAAVLDALGQEAVRGDVRAAQGPFPWEQCRSGSVAPLRPADSRNAVAYAEHDMIARGLAERIVALAWPAERSPLWLRELLPLAGRAPVARGYSPDELSAAIHASPPLAVIAPLPRVLHGGCAAPAAVLRDGTGSLAEVMLGATADWTVIPLLDARDHFVHTAGVGRVIADGDGMIRFATDP